MSSSFQISHTKSLDALSQMIQQFDRNNDGSLNPEEFFDLLKQVAGQVRKGEGVRSPVATAVHAALAATPPVQALGPALTFEGFNFDRTQNPEKSAKDAFAMLAKRVGWMPLGKADAEAWFNAHIKGGLEELGYRVHWVQGDKFKVTAREGDFVVDFVRGAGGEDPALAWQADRA
jgi:hypothetical protein